MAGEIYLEQLQLGPMANYVYLIGSRSTRQVVIVDPAWSIDTLFEQLESRDLTAIGALATHYHPDHIGGEVFGHQIEGISELLERQGMKVYANALEADGLKQLTGLAENDLVRVDSGDKLQIGEVELEFLHTPGHTPGSQCFRVQNMLVSGDTLFLQGCGRVDLPGGDADQLYASLQKLKQLPDDVVIFPGHDYGGGPHLTLAETKKLNPYLRIPTLELWHDLMGN